MTDAGAIRRLFDEAVELPPGAREDLLLRHDPELAAEVRSLLAAHEQKTDLLDHSPIRPVRLEPQRRLGAYRIEGELGRGGMGVVYRASRADDAYQKTVAIKVLAVGVPSEVFRRERQILATLEHPHIARLIDGGQTPEGLLYFVMEYVDGLPLLEFAKARGLGVRDRARLFVDICRAVEFAHGNLVVHRDLKPANVLVTAAGEAKLLDFGVAKVLSPEVRPEATIAALTPRYASPEQLLGRPITTATDIYSLGIVLFELLTDGESAYPTETGSFEEMVRVALEAQPRRPSAYNRAVDRDLDQIVEKAITREPELRYRSVAELREDLERFLRGEAVRARGAGWAYRTRKFVRRHWVGVSASAAVAAALAIGLWSTLASARVANEQRAVAERATAEARRMAAEQAALRQNAEQQAAEANRQRLRAEDRLERARSLAASMLFDVHDSVKALEGSAPARQKILAQSLAQLESLAADSGGDPRLQGTLAAAYERAGDIAIGLGGEGGTAAGQALAYFRKSETLRREAAPLERASILTRIAVAAARAGQLAAAETELEAARRTLREASPADRREKPGRGVAATLTSAACEVAVLGNRQQEALQSCREAVRLADRSPFLDDPALLLARAVAYGKLAVLAHTQKDLAGALALLRGASASFSACLEKVPNHSECRGGLARLTGYLATWKEEVGGADTDDTYLSAIATLERVAAGSPQATSSLPTLAWLRMKYAVFLTGRSRTADARREATASLALYDRLTGAPNPNVLELNDHADNLLKCPVPDLRNAAKALALAERASALTQNRNPFVLDTLANAYLQTGQRAKALETIDRGLAALGNQMPALRQELEASRSRILAAKD